MPLLNAVRQKNLIKIFYPKSVAIVGANNVQGTVPSDIAMNILKADFNGAVYPVSPREKSIGGKPCFKYVTDIKEPVDLAIMVFPSSVGHLALEQCGQKGIKSAIVISAGYKEVGGDGVKREQGIQAIAEKYGISFIGPNCLGVINTDPLARLNASFARAMPAEGGIGFLSQSGALCTAVLDYARAKHIGFSKFVSFGNKADINEIDLLYYLKDDPKTKVILLYLEEISDGRALMLAARDVIAQSGKPVLVLKSGRTTEGASAAASHTGSLAGSDELCDAAFRQAGIIRCNTIEDMFHIAIAFAYQPAPKGNRVAIVTNGGGPGVLAVDATIKAGLKLAAFTDRTTETLKSALPVTANTKNPVDVIGDARADRYGAAMTAAMEDENVDGLFVILTPQSMTEIESIAQEVVRVSRAYAKPVYASFMGEADVGPGVRYLQEKSIPHYFLPEAMAGAFAAVCGFHTAVTNTTIATNAEADIDAAGAHAVLDTALGEKKSYLTENDATQVLKTFGLPVLESFCAATEDEAVSAAERIGYPVVMKVMSEDIVHKSDIGGVVLDIRSADQAKRAYVSIVGAVKNRAPKAVIKGMLVQKMAPAGEEVILGIKRDRAFGPVIMFGLGGIFVEIFKDVSFRVAPVTEEEAAEMMRETKAFGILAGARGRAARDLAAVARCISLLSRLSMECPQIKELDINPLLVHEKGMGCCAADAKIMLV